jgi:hypothetical protein
MSKFELEKKEIQVRGQKVIVREMTHGERMQYMDKAKDVQGITRWVVAACSIDPKLSEDEVADQPGDVVQQMFSAVLDASGLGKKPEKKADASGALPVPTGVGAGEVAH